jgi:hypothetical protein
MAMEVANLARHTAIQGVKPLFPTLERPMRPPCVFLAAALLLSSAGCASTDTFVRPTAQQIADIEGIYALSDGRRARVYGEDNRLYIKIGAHQQKELFLAGPDRFASRHGEVLLRVLPGQGDKPDRIELGFIPALGGRAPHRFASGPIPGNGFLD